MKRIWVTFALYFLVISSASANDVLDLVAFFHNPHDKIRIGIEVEFTGISVEEAVRIVQRAIGGSVDYKQVPWPMMIMESDGRIHEVTLMQNRGEIGGNSTGEKIVIKPEFNDTSGITTRENIKTKVVIELLTSPGPIQFPGVLELQKALDALLEKGAIGTRYDVAVSLQVNVEIGGGKRKKFVAKNIVNLLRNYMRKEHRRQIMDRYNVPEARLQYIQPISPGFMARLLDPGYSPTLEQLKDDAIYRQLKEFLGERERAWSAPIEEIRREVMAYIIETDAFNSKDSPLFRVIKFSPLKVASLLLYAFPNDPLAKLAVKNLWIKLIAAVEFRDRNNDFKVVRAVQEAVGMVRASETFGSFLYDPAKNPAQDVDFSRITDRELLRLSEETGKTVEQIKTEIVRAAIEGTPPQFQTLPLQKPEHAMSTVRSCRQIFQLAN